MRERHAAAIDLANCNGWRRRLPSHGGYDLGGRFTNAARRIAENLEARAVPFGRTVFGLTIAQSAIRRPLML
jgi:hypothetical protein